MADNNMNKLFNTLSQKLGMSEESIKKSAESGNMQDILKNSDSRQAKQLEEVLNDPEKLRRLMNSPQAQALMKMLGNGEDE